MNKLNPWLVTGLCDGEACFTIAIHRKPHTVTYSAQFGLGLRADDREVIFKLRDYFGVGHCHYSVHISSRPNGLNSPAWLFRICGRYCQRLVAHFDQYPLASKKKRDYEIWREFVMLPKRTPKTYQAQLRTALQQVKKLEGFVESPLIEDAQRCLNLKLQGGTYEPILENR